MTSEQRPKPGSGQTDYEKYLRTEELLGLQKPLADRVNPDELLFQTIHQAAELWMKLALNDCERAARMIAEGKELFQAAHLLRRTSMVENLIAGQLQILETMAPADYHVIRLGALGRGSGQESPGFTRLLGLRDVLWPPFEAQLKARGVTPLELFRKPNEHHDLYQVMQGLMMADENFQRFRFDHIQLVKRIIGLDVKSLKGVPAAQLMMGLSESFFPEIWGVVNELTRETKPGYF